MIPRAHVTAWREHAPWPSDAQVEQDLVLSRALVELFRQRELSELIAFRGGTALHKLFLDGGRYSEDIDLIQVTNGAIGPVMKGVRAAPNPWLGKPAASMSANTTTLTYRFETTSLPVQRVRLKIEINTREHVAFLGFKSARFVVDNPWFSGSTAIRTFEIEELLATKFRALYQRKKGRDLGDLSSSLAQLNVDDERLLECFRRYMAPRRLTRALFEKNLAEKIATKSFAEDLGALLINPASYNAITAAELVHARLISRLPGARWKGPGAGPSSPWP